MKKTELDVQHNQTTTSETGVEALDILENISKNIFKSDLPCSLDTDKLKKLPPPIHKGIKKALSQQKIKSKKAVLPVLTAKDAVYSQDITPDIKKNNDKINSTNAHDLDIINIAAETTPKPKTVEKSTSGTKPKSAVLPEILADRYKLERILGVGGMCVVYRAYDILAKHFGNPSPYVALKTFTEEFAEFPDANYLLYSEYALTAKLCHLNIVSVYQFDVDAITERAFITLELLKGITLEQWLIENPCGAIWQHAKPLILPLLEIMEYSHQQGILHGDLKPSNVMLTDDGLKLFDYGLGQAIKGDMVKLPKIARERFNAWTPRYAAPELLEGSPLTEKTDIFALCCIIYEILSGKNPYFKDNSRQIISTPKKPKTLPKTAWRALSCGLSLDTEKRTITLPELSEIFKKPPRFSLF